MSDYINKPFKVERDGLTIKGIFYLPDKEGTFPLVIISPGFRSNMFDNETMAILCARNDVAALIYDFCGATLDGMSDGDFYDMSVLTEKKDLTAVVNKVKDDPRFTELYLVGISQGGLVSALVASEMRDLINGLILFYPALIIPDDVRSRFKSKEDIPDVSPVFDTTVGKAYNLDVYDMDVWEAIKNYDKFVLIFHGDNDEVVPFAYSVKAGNVYKHASIVEVEGEGHGFSEDAYISCIIDMLRFIDVLDYVEKLFK